MDAAGLRSLCVHLGVSRLRDLRALCLPMAATGSQRVGARRAYAVTAALVAVAAEFPVARVSTGRTDTGRPVRSPGPASHRLLALAGRCRGGGRQQQQQGASRELVTPSGTPSQEPQSRIEPHRPSSCSSETPGYRPRYRGR